MEQQTTVVRTSLPDPFDDIHTNLDVNKFFHCAIVDFKVFF